LEGQGRIQLSELAGSCHAAAFIRTALAGGCAFLAVAHLMLGALVAAGLTDICALLADYLREFATTGHIARGEAAYLCAVHVGCYAARHHLDVLLLQAGSSTKVASDSASVTSFNT
jgi:hypothetical protein